MEEWNVIRGPEVLSGKLLVRGGPVRNKEGEDLGPQGFQAGPFEEDVPDDDQEIAQRVDIGKVLNHDRHVGDREDETGKQDDRKDEKNVVTIIKMQALRKR